MNWNSSDSPLQARDNKSGTTIMRFHDRLAVKRTFSQK
jgi:hypothetical protein